MSIVSDTKDQLQAQPSLRTSKSLVPPPGIVPLPNPLVVFAHRTLRHVRTARPFVDMTSPASNTRPPVSIPPTTSYPHARNPSHPPPRKSSLSSGSPSPLVTNLSGKPSIYAQHGNAAAASASTTSLSSQRPGALNDLPLRRGSPTTMAPPQDYHRHRARQHSQGFFEPTLPTASQNNGSSSLTPQQIAAQAAMHGPDRSHSRRRSQTIPEHAVTTGSVTGRRKAPQPSPIQTAHLSPSPTPPPGLASGNTSRNGSYSADNPATTAANAAFPRSPLPSPGFPQSDFTNSPASERETRPSKEKSRMKIFSKPRHINITKDRDVDKKALPSPSKFPSTHALNRIVNHSTTSLNDTNMSGASSLYSASNASTSTLVPLDRATTSTVEKEKQHKHHFLSRQKNKLKDNDNFYPLSSASSNSRPVDPNAPQPLYSFAPSSPAPGATFPKSISGLDLRHGGRALREKKKEEKAEKAAANSYFPAHTGNSDQRDRDGAASDFASGAGPHGQFGPSSSEAPISGQALGQFGLPGMNSDDAWPLLKSRLLIIFEGEELRMPVEDFNRLVSAHLQHCIKRRAPQVIVDDLRELLHTGFSSLESTLRQVPEDRLVPHLVDMWSFVFGTILPFMQAVFLPLDLEFKGHGSMNAREASEFWAALTSQRSRPSSLNPDALTIRGFVLLTFRDTIILPRHSTLLAIFSRLSLDNIDARPLDLPHPRHQYSSSFDRPGTGTSTSSSKLDPDSFNSQSTLLDSTTGSSLGARSRATSNTSAGSFHSASSQQRRAAAFQANRPPLPTHTHPVMDPAKVTQTAARMLQCVSVLAGLGALTPASGASGTSNSTTTNADLARTSSSDSHPSASPDAHKANTDSEAAGWPKPDDPDAAARKQMDQLARELKLNWMARGRTGRNRKGFVGTKTGGGGGSGSGSGPHLPAPPPGGFASVRSGGMGVGMVGVGA